MRSCAIPYTGLPDKIYLSFSFFLYFNVDYYSYENMVHIIACLQIAEIFPSHFLLYFV